MSISLNTQRGMALLVSLVFMLLLSLLGLNSMVSATRQEKMAAGVQHANQSFQAAEAALRSGESWLQSEWSAVLACTSPVSCNPPEEARTQSLPMTGPYPGCAGSALWMGCMAFRVLGQALRQPTCQCRQLPVFTA